MLYSRRISFCLSQKVDKRLFSRLLNQEVLPLSHFINQKINSDPLENAALQIRDVATTNGLSYYIETYGCQMNLSDTEIVRSILTSSGYSISTNLTEADIIITNTCAIRENAEQKVWNRLKYFHSLRRKNKKRGVKSYYPIVGVLGCMAERLKERLLHEESVDFVCGPDAYRDIPRLLNQV
jgi:hypothetical protein